MTFRQLTLAAAVAALTTGGAAAQQPVVLTGPAIGLPPASFKHRPTIEQFLKPGYPEELESAAKADRIAWMGFEAGKRDVYTAAAPDFKTVRLTNFPRDEGDVLTDTQLSADGSVIVFVHGGAPNREGWVANPTARPAGSVREIWAVRSSGGAPWRVAEGSSPQLSPDGRWVLFVNDGQIHRAAVNRASQVDSSTRGLKPYIREWGTQANPRWSPDGSKIAWVSNRVDHSFVVVFDVNTRTVTYLAPGVDFDSSPTWSEDGKHVAFLRRPGLAFGQQAQQGTGSLGNPNGPAFGRGGAGRVGGDGIGRGGGGGRAGGGGRGGRDTGAAPAGDDRPGLFSARFANGSNLAFWVGDPVTGEAHEIWHNERDETVFNGISSIDWAGESVIFQLEPEEWTRWYAVRVDGSTPRPIELTPGDGQVEHTSLSKDGRTLFYTTNYLDRERRHVWRVSTSGGPAEQVTTGEGIETFPVALASGKFVATLSSSATRPFGVGVWLSAAGQAPEKQVVVYPTLGKDFPAGDMVTPQLVVTKAADGMEIHNQLFLPKDLKPGEKRPAIIFVHGGPVRQMLLGDHYMWFYHTAYMTNQWLASLGYVVMSVNYRSGIGYGKSFRNAAGRGGAGNSEYQDVVAGGKYLQSRPDVDPKRVGIWGLSYGGVLTSQALARNSDIFVAGVDLAGVHLWGSSLEPDAVSYQSSTISAMDTWKSPVLLVQGDDDRNVAFQQMTGLVQLLRAHHVPYELIVFPDDTHESLLDSRWMYTYARMEAFLDTHLRNASPTSESAVKRAP